MEPPQPDLWKTGPLTRAVDLAGHGPDQRGEEGDRDEQQEQPAQQVGGSYAPSVAHARDVRGRITQTLLITLLERKLALSGHNYLVVLTPEELAVNLL